MWPFNLINKLTLFASLVPRLLPYLCYQFVVKLYFVVKQIAKLLLQFYLNWTPYNSFTMQTTFEDTWRCNKSIISWSLWPKNLFLLVANFFKDNIDPSQHLRQFFANFVKNVPTFVVLQIWTHEASKSTTHYFPECDAGRVINFYDFRFYSRFGRRNVISLKRSLKEIVENFISLAT